MYDYDYESYLDEMQAELLDKRTVCNDPSHEYDSSLGLRGEPIKVENRKQFETKDSGKKAQYADGMQRDTSDGKPQFSLMFPKGVPYEEQLITRLADLYHRGAKKYGDRNWEKSCTEESLAHHEDAFMRHVIKFLMGMEDEDHAAAVVWNVNAILLTRRNIREAETMKRVDDFLDDPSTGVKRERPFPTVEFSEGDEILDKNNQRWKFTGRVWWSEFGGQLYDGGMLPKLAKDYGPLMFQTGAYAGITMLTDGSLRWG